MCEVTVSFVFRERVTPTLGTLKQIIDTTSKPYELIVYDDASPPEIADALRQMADTHGFLLLRGETQTPSNAQRNACLEHVKTPYVVFVDNDIAVEPGWLDALVACAKETGAGLVSPLTLERMGSETRIHLFGGDVVLRTSEGLAAFDEKHDYQHANLEANRSALVRTETNLAELHALLADTRLLRDIGGLDPEFMNMAEHADLSVRVQKAGRSIFAEPDAVITHEVPLRLDAADRQYFLRRWSEAWSRNSALRAAEVYGVPKDGRRTAYLVGWARFHRHRATLNFPMMRRLLGRKWHDRVVRRLIGPVEVRWNRLRYPE